jgi:hypothetical protein
VHSVVTQGVIASDAQKLNLHTVCKRAASGQLLFLGLLFRNTLSGLENTMNRTTHFSFIWLAVAATGLGFAFLSPNESKVMGQMPAHDTQSLSRTPVSLPAGLPTDRTLALVTFNRNQRGQADSWITGLNLKNDSSISWVRILVLNDPGSPDGRSDAEKRLLERYTNEAERTKMLPMFTDKAAFAQATGLNSTEHAYAVVLNRQGDVLARAAGSFDATKAQALRETLSATAE